MATTEALRTWCLLGGLWDFVTGVIHKVTVVIPIIITPVKVLITVLTKSHEPPSRHGSRCGVYLNPE